MGHPASHAPQLVGLVWMSVHAEPHTMLPEVQHWPEVQLSPVEQAMLHEPHACGEVVRSKQPGVPASAAHFTMGAPLSVLASSGQVKSQNPLLHTALPVTVPSGAVHWAPHPPQFCRSLVRS